MSVKLANKFLEKNRINERILARIDEYDERDSDGHELQQQFEMTPKIKYRRISSIFRVKERQVSQFTLDCVTTIVIFFGIFILVSRQVILYHH